MHKERLPRRLIVAVFCVFGCVLGSVAHAQTAPVIEQVTPTSGPTGTVVQINGRRFAPDATVRLGAQNVVIVDHMPNRLSVRIPPVRRVATSPSRPRRAPCVGPSFASRRHRLRP